jgi:hypothetical protein
MRAGAPLPTAARSVSTTSVSSAVHPSAAKPRAIRSKRGRSKTRASDRSRVLQASESVRICGRSAARSLSLLSSHAAISSWKVATIGSERPQPSSSGRTAQNSAPTFLVASDVDQYIPQFVTANFEDEALEMVKAVSSELRSRQAAYRQPRVSWVHQERGAVGQIARVLPAMRKG